MLRANHTFARLTNTCGKLFARKWLLGSVATLALAGGVPAVAQAGHDYDRYDRVGDRYDHDRPRVELGIRIGEPSPGHDGRYDRRETRFGTREVRVWVPPVYKTVCDKRWIEPVYQTVCEKKWVEPVYQTVCEKAWVPDVFETRECRRYDPRCGRTVTVIERVLVRPGHFENRDRQVCVTAGHFETCERRVCVAEGRFETVDRQELVCDGHYETRVERVVVRDTVRERVEVVNPGPAGLSVSVRR